MRQSIKKNRPNTGIFHDPESHNLGADDDTCRRSGGGGLRQSHVLGRRLDLQRDLKRTIIFVSHDLDEAFKLGDRIAIMEGGRIVQCGAPQEIFTAPADAYVADFVAHMNPLGVLCTRDLMQTATGTLTHTVGAAAPVREVIPTLCNQPEPLGVVEDGTLIGMITRVAVLRRLVSPNAGEPNASTDVSDTP